MKFKKWIFIFSSILLGGQFLLSTPLHAKQTQATAESCALGSTCTIPGKDGGLTYFIVTPRTGTDYYCVVWNTTGRPAFPVYVFDGKDYIIESGAGMYTVDPSVRIPISGRFLNPNDPDAIGHIKFQAFAEDVKGFVTCRPGK